jgi:hypothetical protein
MSETKQECEKYFGWLGRSEKSDFISANIQLASANAVASYVKSYLFDVLRDVNNDEYVATYLREKGYECIKKK